MTDKTPKRPRDLNHWAKRMVDLATDRAERLDAGTGGVLGDVDER